jgi:hypothetical protein
MEFVVDKVALGDILLRVLLISPVSVISLSLLILLGYVGDEQRHVVGCSSETVSSHRHEQQEEKILREAGSLLFCLDNQDFPIVIDLECALQPSQNPDR